MFFCLADVDHLDLCSNLMVVWSDLTALGALVVFLRFVLGVDDRFVSFGGGNHQI